MTTKGSRLKASSRSGYWYVSTTDTASFLGEAGRRTRLAGPLPPRAPGLRGPALTCRRTGTFPCTGPDPGARCSRSCTRAWTRCGDTGQARGQGTGPASAIWAWGQNAGPCPPARLPAPVDLLHERGHGAQVRVSHLLHQRDVIASQDLGEGPAGAGSRAADSPGEAPLRPRPRSRASLAR